ncbi:MAG TPA: NADH-quinone oxidoreductase subunit K [Gemmataceae bacterium]
MNTFAEIILVFVLVINLALLGSGRLSGCIRLVAAQGVVLGLLPLFVGVGPVGARLLLLAAVIFALKGVVFPRLLFRSLRLSNARREATPGIGLTASVVLGVAVLIASFWMAAAFRVPVVREAVSNLLLPVALATALSGLLLIVSRRQALSQVVGYLVLENGIFVFGVGLAPEEPLLIEMGILLDVFAAVLVMGIAVFHISREFDHIDVEQLSQLRD